MNKVVLVFAVVALLNGCGGSDTETKPVITTPDQTVPPVKVDTLPVLKMDGVVLLKAEVETETVFDIEEHDGDTLSVVFSNQPAWLTYSVINKKLRIKTKPTLFALGEYDLPFTLSDGKNNLLYTLKLSVADNPAKWATLLLDEQELQGVWTNETGDQTFSFMHNRQGYWINNNGGVKRFAHSLSYSLALDLSEVGCIAEICETLDRIVIRPIAQAGNRIRFLVSESGKEDYSVTLTKQPMSLNTGAYTIKNSQPKVSYVGISIVDTTSDDSSLQVSFDIRANGNSSSWYLRQTAYFPMTFKGGVTELPEYTYQDSFSIRNENTFELEDLQVTYRVNAKIMGATAQHLFVEIETIGEPQNLKGQLSDYSGLSDLVRLRHYVSLLEKLDAAPAIEFVPGTSYLTRLYEKAQTISDPHYFGGSLTFTLDDATTGKAYAKKPDLEAVFTVPFSYEFKAGKFVVTTDGQVEEKRFFKFPNGQTGMTLKYTYPETNTTSYTLYAVKPVNFTANKNDYLGTFEILDNEYEGEKRYFTLSSEGKAVWSGALDATPRFLTRYENDGSLSLLYDNDCEFPDQPFDDCLAFIKKTNPDTYYLINIKLVHREGSNFGLAYSINSTYGFYNSLRTLKKVN
ncbi:hypothetical protein NI389_05530 [Pseudoalteromonas xiamenensis]|uniref:hypothetical protein n=1 Tax=Pseudoalteromonas xiamenensis TaxID=882626 RepID=UPI0027E541DA|nr:hypothetical protein [Pseudoalteromonas xiamenensis]WMN60871.1 hypothetical protein NI389_05530 [Pseudoalteromonas xiamenensis]